MVAHIHLFAYGTCHAVETEAELVVQLLAHGTHTTVAQVVDIVHFCLGVDQFDEVADNGDDVLIGQHARLLGNVEVQFFVNTITSDFAEVVSFIREEELVEGGARGLLVGRRCALQLQVYVFYGFLARLCRVFLQGVENDGVVHHFLIFLMEQHGLDVRIGNHVDVLFLEDGFTIDDHFRTFDVGHLARLIVNKVLVPRLDDISGKFLADEFFQVRLRGLHLLGDVEDGKNVLVGLIADGAEERGDRQFLFAVDIGVHHIVDVRRELHPRSLEGDDASRVQGCSVGVIGETEEHAGRTV